MTDYRGTIATTKSGKQCQNWIHYSNTYNTGNYPNAGLEQNYCRNPDPSTGEKAWCYTSNLLGLYSWEYCNVPNCFEGSSEFKLQPSCGSVDWKQNGKFKSHVLSITASCYENSNIMKNKDYRGTVATTKNGDTCKKWSDFTLAGYNSDNYPNAGLAENYCRNPDPVTEEKAWCYKNNISGVYQWDYCNVPYCFDASSQYKLRQVCGTVDWKQSGK